MLETIDQTITDLNKHDYVLDRPLATAVFLALKMKKPLFLEGESGVGKTEIAKVLSNVLATPLIRLQCYEGLDVSSAAYEWDYAKQILEIKLLESRGELKGDDLKINLFSDKFLLKRPLLKSLEPQKTGERPVLLIDELDRADEPFEAFLLELLSEFQITIPEIGLVKASKPPIVIITSNRTREIHDAIKRRCIYHWVGYPEISQELNIVTRKVQDIDREFARQIVDHVQRLRKKELFKTPGTAETIDWAIALQNLGENQLSESNIKNTLGVLLKHKDDILESSADEKKS